MCHGVGVAGVQPVLGAIRVHGAAAPGRGRRHATASDALRSVGSRIRHTSERRCVHGRSSQCWAASSTTMIVSSLYGVLAVSGGRFCGTRARGAGGCGRGQDGGQILPSLVLNGDPGDSGHEKV
jgi:hypothetical protein